MIATIATQQDGSVVDLSLLYWIIHQCLGVNLPLHFCPASVECTGYIGIYVPLHNHTYLSPRPAARDSHRVGIGTSQEPRCRSNANGEIITYVLGT